MATDTKTQMHVTAVEILGETGTTYRITTNGDAVHCTCPAFQYRKNETAVCKHIRYVAELVA